LIRQISTYYSDQTIGKFPYFLNHYTTKATPKDDFLIISMVLPRNKLPGRSLSDKISIALFLTSIRTFTDTPGLSASKGYTANFSLK